jgi:MFS superfamily sulfate permease-like transporter
VLAPTTGEHFRSIPPTPQARSLDGLVLYHFAASLYYANSNHFSEEILGLTGDATAPVAWLCIDASAIADVDYSGAQTLGELARMLEARQVRLLLAEVAPEVRRELDRYGVTTTLGPNAYFETLADAIRAFREQAAGS